MTDDAKADKKAGLRGEHEDPAMDKDIPAVGSDTKVDNATGSSILVGTFDSYTQDPAQIIMSAGEIQTTKKKAPVHKPSAAHHTTTH